MAHFRVPNHLRGLGRRTEGSVDIEGRAGQSVVAAVDEQGTVPIEAERQGAKALTASRRHRPRIVLVVFPCIMVEVM